MQEVGDLAGRIRELVRATGKSERALCREVGLPETTLSSLLPRLKKNPLAAELKTLALIAKGAGVTLHQLLFGVRSTEESGEELRPLPQRAIAAEQASREGIWPEAIRSVCARPTGPRETRMDAHWWLHMMKARELEMIDEAREAQRCRNAREPPRAEEGKPTPGFAPPSQPSAPPSGTSRREEAKTMEIPVVKRPGPAR